MNRTIGPSHEDFAMALPAEAFAEISPSELKAGSVFKFGDDWALLVSYEDEITKDFLMLGGGRAGSIFRVPPDMPRFLTLKHPFSWYAALEEGASPVNTDHQTVVLTLTSRGPVVLGARHSNRGTEYFAFGLDGVVDREFQTHGVALRFTGWTAEVQHSDQPYKSLGRIFSVLIPLP